MSEETETTGAVVQHGSTIVEWPRPNPRLPSPFKSKPAETQRSVAKSSVAQWS